jgi:hypothetical protein
MLSRGTPLSLGHEITPTETQPNRLRGQKLRCAGWCAWLVVVFAACASSISQFSPVAYKQATSLKVESLALMQKATQPYANHQAEIEALITKVDEAYEYARGRPKNEISTRMWDVLRDPNRNLLGGFLARWKNRSTLGPAFVSDARDVVSDAFDQIIGLESGKIRPKDAKVP